MRRFIIFAVLLTVSGFVLAAGCPSPIHAQSAGDMAGDVAGQPLGTAPLTTLPGQQLGLRRVVVEPGARLPLWADAGGFIVYTESGAWTYLPGGGEARVSRAVDTDPSPLPGPLIANSALGYGSASSAASARDELVTGGAVALAAGDVLAVTGEGDAFVKANDGSAVLLIAEVSPIVASLVPAVPKAVAIPVRGS